MMKLIVAFRNFANAPKKCPKLGNTQGLPSDQKDIFVEVNDYTVHAVLRRNIKQSV
jgi:hypothetical protein